VENERSREQFGRVIGSFQAMKHLCTDTLLSIAAGPIVVLATTAVQDKAHDGLDKDQRSTALGPQDSKFFSR